MQTGENEHGLRKINDWTRLMGIVLLIIHFYLTCYAAFSEWHLTAAFANRLLLRLFPHDHMLLKGMVLATVGLNVLGTRARKSEKVSVGNTLTFIVLGLVLFIAGSYLLLLPFDPRLVSEIYISVTVTGYLLLLSGSTQLSRLIRVKLAGDIFNRQNQTFPQEERLLENEYSINLPAQYNLKGKIRNSFINITNPFRGTLVIGGPGAGKSYFVIRHFITQQIRKGHSMLLYDFKYDDLSKIAYNALLKYAKNYAVQPTYWVIDFDRLLHRCNPLYPESMIDITDASDSSRTIMLGLNREWIKKQGDFFVESSINFVTAVIWFLRKYENGKYCTLPHVIELMQADYDKLFPLLSSEPEVEVLVNPFISAWKNQAFDQLEGQIASAKISMARLASPQLYYVLSGNDFTLDLNNPEAPKIICLGNNPQKRQVYGPVLSLYISRALKLVNQKDRLKSSLIFDEFPTIYFNGMDDLIATARSNKVATTLAVQNYSQLKKDYGRDQAEVILNIVGNVISGQAAGDTAKHLSERFGKILQERESISINSQDTSVSRSVQLDEAIPSAVIATLSSGEFVGMVADDPEVRIPQKMFHNYIINDHEAIANEEKGYLPMPEVTLVTQEQIGANYFKIRQEIINILYDSE